MKPTTERALERATKDALRAALLSACQELAESHRGHDMFVSERLGYIAAGSLNNQVIKHLNFPDTIVEG